MDVQVYIVHGHLDQDEIHIFVHVLILGVSIPVAAQMAVCTAS